MVASLDASFRPVDIQAYSPPTLAPTQPPPLEGNFEELALILGLSAGGVLLLGVAYYVYEHHINPPSLKKKKKKSEQGEEAHIVEEYDVEEYDESIATAISLSAEEQRAYEASEAGVLQPAVRRKKTKRVLVEADANTTSTTPPPVDHMSRSLYGGSFVDVNFKRNLVLQNMEQENHFGNILCAHEGMENHFFLDILNFILCAFLKYVSNQIRDFPFSLSPLYSIYHLTTLYTTPPN